MGRFERPAAGEPPAAGRLLAAVRGQARWFRSSVFVRQVAVLAGGTTAAQLISVAFAPLLARLYGPEAFGAVGIFIAMLGVLVPLATGAFGSAVVLPKSDRQALALMRLSLLVALGVGLASLLLVIVARDPIAAAAGFDIGGVFLFLAPISLLALGLQLPIRQWLVRRRRFGAIARVAVADAFLSGVAKSLFGWVAASPAILLILTIAGQTLQTLLLSLAAIRSQPAPPTPGPAESKPGAPESADSDSAAPATVAWALKAYRDFPAYRMPQMWLNAVGLGLPTLLLGAFFGPAAAGYYAVANRVLGLPSTVILGAFGTVLSPRLAETAHSGQAARPLLAKSTAALAVAGALPFAGLIVFGPTIFGFVFGSEWTRAGLYAAWLGLATFAQFLATPSIAAVPVLHLQRWFLGFEIVTVACYAAALAVGAWVFDDDLAAVAGFALVACIANLVLICVVLARARRPSWERT